MLNTQTPARRAHLLPRDAAHDFPRGKRSTRPREPFSRYAKGMLAATCLIGFTVLALMIWRAFAFYSGGCAPC